MSNVSLERNYFVLSDGALTSEMSKMAFIAFCNKTILMHLDKNSSLKGIVEQCYQFFKYCICKWFYMLPLNISVLVNKLIPKKIALQIDYLVP